MKPTKQITDDLFKYSLPDKATEEQKEANPIASQEIVEALKAGKSVEITNAIIEGPVNLESEVINGKISILNSEIKGLVVCSYAEFKRVVNFKNTTFKSDVIFTAAAVDKDIILNEATFDAKTDFTDLLVNGAFYADSSTFNEPLNFIAVRIARRTVFTGAKFMQQAMFAGSYLSGAAFFNSATFGGEANFVSAVIEGQAYFKSATFEGEAKFVSLRVGGCADFDGAIFKKEIVFHRTNVNESLFFRKANFGGEADFGYIRIGSNAEFTGAEFQQRAIFNSAQIDGHALFTPVVFKGNADFAGTMFRSGAAFAGVQFMGPVSFYNIESKMDVGFGGAVFAKDVTFQNTSLRSVLFGTPEGKHKTEFKGGIDLRGCTYDSIEPIGIWEELMDRLKPYDRQPFTQLEETFRRAGRSGLAKDVYFQRKCTEFSLFKKTSPLPWAKHTLLRGLAGWGVKLERLFGAIALVLVLGTLLFHQKGSVEPKMISQPVPTVETRTEADEAMCLTYVEAFWVSLNLFLPIEIAAGSDWKPSSQRFWGVIKFTSLATIWKLLGWILVPLAVAGLSGLLKR